MGKKINEEIMHVLKMVESGIIDAEKAYEMLDVLGYGIKEDNSNKFNNQENENQNNNNNNNISNKKGNRKGKIHIKVIENGNLKTSVDIPSKFLNFFDKFTQKSFGKKFDINTDEEINKKIKEKIDEGLDIEIVVENKKVKIYDEDGNIILNVNEY